MNLNLGRAAASLKTGETVVEPEIIFWNTLVSFFRVLCAVLSSTDGTEKPFIQFSFDAFLRHAVFLAVS